MLTQEEYNARRQARYERLKAAAARAEREGQTARNQAHDMAQSIPFGQPILVGHHSEKGDRAFRDKIENKFRRGFELAQKADELKSRAASVASNDAIYSDDPSAPDQLRAKLTELEAKQERMKATNKAIKKGDRAALVALGHASSLIDQWLSPEPMPWPGKGYAGFELTNNNAKIKATKDRLALVEKKQSIPDKDETIGDIKVEWRASENRIRILYPARVDRDTFAKLRQYGYRAMKEDGVFSAYYNYRAGQFINELRAVHG